MFQYAILNFTTINYQQYQKRIDETIKNIKDNLSKLKQKVDKVKNEREKYKIDLLS